jgi:itaconate CoA-transferase
MRPLDGVLVVAVEQAVAAPFATRQLADLGARVVKVERPDGGDFARGYDAAVRGLASHFVWLNRAKESLAVDLKSPGGMAVLERLIARADVVVQNLGPGVAARLGFDAPTLVQARPELIAVDISGYGPDGPYRDKRAYDALVQGESGLVSVTGVDGHPAKSGIPVADIAAAMYAYASVLAALFRRERTGEGGVITVSMLEALTEWMGHPLYLSHYGGTPPPRTGTAHPIIVPYDAYPTADGDLVLISVQNDREWVRLAVHVLARPELAEDAELRTNIGRVRNRERVDYAVSKVTSGLPTHELIARLDDARIANARLNDLRQLAEHPQLRHRQRWQDVDSPAGPLQMLLPPAGIDGVDPRMDAIPALGEHTDGVLAELGYDAAAIAELRATGAVA